MTKMRIAKEEMKLIQDVSDRFAKRMNAKFVVDPEKVQVIEDADSQTEEAPISEDDGLDLL